MKSLVVAGTRLHAQAMIKWARLDPSIWHPVAYGEMMTGDFAYAKLVRPLNGVEEHHAAWVFDHLQPRIAKEITGLPDAWCSPWKRQTNELPPPDHRQSA